jgi:hypothetical protein
MKQGGGGAPAVEAYFLGPPEVHTTPPPAAGARKHAPSDKLSVRVQGMGPARVAELRELIASGRYVPFAELRANVAELVARGRTARVARGHDCQVDGCTRGFVATCDEPLWDEWTCNLRLCTRHRRGEGDTTGRDRCPAHQDQILARCASALARYHARRRERARAQAAP